MRPLSTRVLDNAFGHPRGLLGRLGGVVMAHGNAATELRIVQLAHLGAADHVGVIGPGPGIGLQAAGERAARAVGVEPSEQMRRAAAHRCAELVESGRVVLTNGTAQDTGLPDQSFDCVFTVNNTHLWPDRSAALAELYRILRPGGAFLLSTHERWLAGGRADLQREAERTGFTDVQTWAWEPQSISAATAAQLRARRPA